MSRPLRIEFAGALYHVTSRGDRKEATISPQLSATPTLDHFLSVCINKKAAMRAAYASGAYTLKDIADFFGVHYSTASRVVKTR